MIKNYPTSNMSTPTDYGFDILKTLNNNGITKWSIIYDIKNSQVQFRTSTATQVKYLDFDNIDFSCNSTSQVYNLDNQDTEGNISDLLIDYDKSKSKKCLKAMWKGAMAKESFLNRVLVKKWATKGMINYTETVYCKDE